MSDMTGDAVDMREACALLVLDETATPVCRHTLGFDGAAIDLDPAAILVQARLTFAQAIRKMSWDDAMEILWLNRDERRPTQTEVKS